jgi:hypothetical protein
VVGISVATVVILVIAGFLALFGAPSFAALAGAPPAPGSSLTASSSVPPGCNPTQGVAAPDRTALLIPNKNPTATAVVGDHVEVTLEFNATAETVPVPGLKVYTPTIFVEMPTTTGTNFPVTLSNHTFVMTSAPWTTLSYSKLVASNFTFNGGANGSLSTQKIGTMADTPYGTLMLQWRWSWNITTPNGTYVQGAWTVPTTTIKTGDWLPSIFKPAPYVELVSESPPDELVGATYVMNITGDVSERAFYLEFENSIGHVVATKWVTDGSHTNGTFAAKFTLLGSNGSLYPGKYLMHIHDSCGALLYSKDLTVTFPPTALIQIVTSPVSCGSVTLNGTLYTNGESATIVPSVHSFKFSYSACPGYTFESSTHAGGIDIPVAGSFTMIVSCNGTYTVNFRPTS